MIENPFTLLPIAYRAACQVVRCRLLAEEAGERAVHLFTVAMLQGCAPDHPKAWLRSVARRSALALLQSDWARQRSIEEAEMAACPAPFSSPYDSGVDFVRERLAASLSHRQRQALAAAVSCNSTRAAARSCGMQPRDFRRSLGTISRKARAMIAANGIEDAFADNVIVQFRLGS
jgi:DNA-directed RNA polymerase specialized sigma24 family protein